MLESLFNPENALMCFINKIIDLVVLSILWTLCSAPLVTMGAASAALYYALTKSVRCQRGHAAKEFWRAFKSNLKRGILFELVWAALAFMMLVTDVPLVTTFLDTGKVQNVFLLILFAVKAVLLIGAACWYYPMISRFEQGVWKTAEAAVFSYNCGRWSRSFHSWTARKHSYNCDIRCWYRWLPAGSAIPMYGCRSPGKCRNHTRQNRGS